MICPYCSGKKVAPTSSGFWCLCDECGCKFKPEEITQRSDYHIAYGAALHTGMSEDDAIAFALSTVRMHDNPPSLPTDSWFENEPRTQAEKEHDHEYAIWQKERK